MNRHEKLTRTREDLFRTKERALRIHREMLSLRSQLASSEGELALAKKEVEKLIAQEVADVDAWVHEELEASKSLGAITTETIAGCTGKHRGGS